MSLLCFEESTTQILKWGTDNLTQEAPIFMYVLFEVVKLKQVNAMGFFRKCGNVLGTSVSSYVSEEMSSSKPLILQVIRCMSSSKLYIGGLSYKTNDKSLREAFSKYGDVAEVLQRG
ncbi:hypothetical protein ACS0TY_034644 [Phlomoides rotata]